MVYNGAAAGCTGTSHQATFSMSAVAAQGLVRVQFRVGSNLQIGGTGFESFGVSMCGAAIPSSGLLLSAVGNNWVKQSYASPVSTTAGQSCAITLTFNVNAADVGANFDWLLDSFYVRGASGLIPSYNFAMYSIDTGQFYNVTAADTPQNSTLPTGGLTLTVNTQGSAPGVTLAPITPDLVLPGLAGSNTVQVCVTVLYCNTFITPTSLLNPMQVWLTSAAQALACLLQITSPSNQFPQGSSIVITNGNALMASGYLDINHQFPAFLPPGTYTVALASGSFAYSTTVTVSAAATSFTIPITGLTGNAFVGGLGTISYNAGWDAALQNVVYYYTDSSTSTSFLRVDLLKSNASGSFVIGTASFSPGPYGTVQSLFSCHTDACNSTLSAGLSVLLTATNQFGILQPYGPVSLTTGGALPGIPGTPPSGALGGMSEFFPGLNYLQLGGFFALVVGASAFGEYDAPAGAIFLAILGAILDALGALAWPALVTASLVVVAVLSFMEWREKRSMNPYGV